MIKLWHEDEMPLRQPGILPELPSLIPYLLPEAKAPVPAVIVCPGGGYDWLCKTFEGDETARWLNTLGVAAFVLHYRILPYRHPVPLLDATRAMRLVRENASQWNIDPDKIGIMGFSAGGHLASSLATSWDLGDSNSADPIERQSSRPDFQILVYPVITLWGPYTKTVSSVKTLLGEDSTSEEICLNLSPYRHVTEQTPQAFVVHSTQDTNVPVEHSRMYVEALRQHHVPVDYLELTSGDHGLGLGHGPEWETWQRHCKSWLLDLMSAP